MGVNLRSWLTYHIKKYDDVYAGFTESARRDSKLKDATQKLQMRGLA